MAPPSEPLSVVVLGGGTVGAQVVRLLEEQAEDLDEERELLDTDVEDVDAVEDLETLDVDETSEDLHDED